VGGGGGAENTGVRVLLIYQKVHDCSRREKIFLKDIFNAQKYILKVKHDVFSLTENAQALIFRM
jgi:hypothetical protein